MRAGRKMRPPLALLAALVALAGCGAGEDDDQAAEAPDAAGVGEIVRAGSTAQFADCGDWRRGTVEERYATVADIRGLLTPQRSETAESDLADEGAYRLFQKACAADFTDSMRLYKLYATAEAFAPFNAALDSGE